MDFTLKIYQNLLQYFTKNQYQFITFKEYIHKFSNTKTPYTYPTNSTPKHLNSSTSKQKKHSTSKLIILRHDVDRLPENSLQTAIIEHELGIKGTYYFRVVPESYNLNIMEKIAKLGHEIGYHYEDVDLVSSKQYAVGSRQYAVGGRQKTGGIKRDDGKSKINHQSSIINHPLIDAAYESFRNNLAMLRQHFDIKTICMHGSPRSKYDNKLIWTKYNYRELRIIGEPYFDIDFTEFAYYTDTGRRWDGDSVSVRDKVHSRQRAVGSKQGRGVTRGSWPRFRKTMEIIKAVEEGRFPPKAMITVHPQRWTDRPGLWVKELVWQNFKNVVKWGIVKVRSR